MRRGLALEAGGVPVDLAGVEHGVAALADVDERRLHARQHVLHPAEVDVADHRGAGLRWRRSARRGRRPRAPRSGCGRRAGARPSTRSTASRRARNSDSVRIGPAAAGLAAVAAALPLGLEPGRALDRGAPRRSAVARLRATRRRRCPAGRRRPRPARRRHPAPTGDAGGGAGASDAEPASSSPCSSPSSLGRRPARRLLLGLGRPRSACRSPCWSPDASCSPFAPAPRARRPRPPRRRRRRPAPVPSSVAARRGPRSAGCLGRRRRAGHRRPAHCRRPPACPVPSAYVVVVRHRRAGRRGARRRRRGAGVVVSGGLEQHRPASGAGRRGRLVGDSAQPGGRSPAFASSATSARRPRARRSSGSSVCGARGLGAGLRLGGRGRAARLRLARLRAGRTAGTSPGWSSGVDRHAAGSAAVWVAGATGSAAAPGCDDLAVRRPRRRRGAGRLARRLAWPAPRPARRRSRPGLQRRCRPASRPAVGRPRPAPRGTGASGPRRRPAPRRVHRGPAGREAALRRGRRAGAASGAPGRCRSVVASVVSPVVMSVIGRCSRRPRAPSTPCRRRAGRSRRRAAVAVTTEVVRVAPLQLDAGRTTGARPASGGAVVRCDGQRIGHRTGCRRAVPAPAGSPGRVTAARDRPPTRSAVRTSSGRTAGVTCRTTSSQYRTGPRQPLRRARRPRPDSARRAGRAPRRARPGRGRRSVRRPSLVSRSTGDLLGGQERRDRRLAHRRAHARAARSASRGLEPVGQRAGGGLDHLEHVQPGGSAASSAARTAVRVARSGTAISTYSASLADAGRRGADVARSSGAGVKPAEYAIGTSARRSARSNARAKSRWLVNRSRPRLAYRSRSRCTAGGGGGPSGVPRPSVGVGSRSGAGRYARAP